MKVKKYPFFAGTEGRCSLYVHEGENWIFGKQVQGQCGLGVKENKYSFPKILTNFKGRVIKFSSGNNHSLMTTDAFAAYGTGRNRGGELGMGRRVSEKDEFTVIESFKDKKVVDVSCGYFHSLWKTNTGRIYSSGSNSGGSCGIGRNGTVYEPKEVIFPKKVDVKMMKGGSDYSLFLTRKGELFITGKIFFGAGERNLVPKRMYFNEFVDSIACGHQHFLCITDSQKVFSYGSNGNGQCGDGSTRNINVLTQIKKFEGMRVRQVSTGYWHSFILLDNSTLYSCGYNSNGEIGSGKKMINKNPLIVAKDVDQVFGCGHSSFYIDNRGRVWATGSNSNFELGLGHKNETRFWTINPNIPPLKPINIEIPFKLLYTFIEKQFYTDLCIKTY